MLEFNIDIKLFIPIVTSLSIFIFSIRKRFYYRSGIQFVLMLLTIVLYGAAYTEEDRYANIFASYSILVLSTFILCLHNKRFWVFGVGFMVVGTTLLAIILDIIGITSNINGISVIDSNYDLRKPSNAYGQKGSIIYWRELILFCFAFFGAPIGAGIGVKKAYDNIFGRIVGIMVNGACIIAFIPISLAALFVTFGRIVLSAESAPPTSEILIMNISIVFLYQVIKLSLSDLLDEFIDNHWE